MPHQKEEAREPRTDKEFIRERLYGKLKTPGDIREEEKAKKEKAEKKNWYFKLYDFTEKNFVKKKTGRESPDDIKETGPQLPKKYREAFDFLGWKLEDEVVMKMPTSGAMLALFGSIFITFILFGVLSALGMLGSALVLLFLLFLPILMTLSIVSYIQGYPLNVADSEKMKAITYVPEIINYIIMQMRLQPNLERAVEFASEHGKGKIAKELGEVLWKNQVGIYENIEEGLDELAYKWEPYSEEFKHAVTMIRASVLIPNTVERNMLLDKIVDDILDSTKEKMTKYSASMKQPSMYLFYLAILLPLMILIMLPVAAAFMGLPVASAGVIGFLYVFLLPLISLLYARSVLAKAPGGYSPPEIPDDYPGLPKKGTMVWKGIKLPIAATAIIVFIIIAAIGFHVDSSMQMSEADKQRYMDIHQGKAPQEQHYIQYFLPMSVALPLSIYLYGKSVHKRKIQLKIMKMEEDFKDAIYLLASRLGERKPLEDCIKYAVEFMPDSPVSSELFTSVQRNVMVLGLTLKSAIFDPTYGAMKYIPSRMINSAFNILTDSIELGPEVASVSLISVSNQMRNIQKIKETMKASLSDITGMMGTMGTFVGPVVLGVVASLQSIIKSILGQVAKGGSSMSASGTGQSAMGITEDTMANIASPQDFQIIVGIYILELVIILGYFSAKINHGDNKTAVMLSIAKSLPLSIIVFTASLVLGGFVMGGMVM